VRIVRFEILELLAVDDMYQEKIATDSERMQKRRQRSSGKKAVEQAVRGKDAMRSC
jgi:hypothetical protein